MKGWFNLPLIIWWPKCSSTPNSIHCSNVWKTCLAASPSIAISSMVAILLLVSNFREIIWILELYIWYMDAKGIKNVENAFLVFFALFWAYVRQPHNHKGWATHSDALCINLSYYPKDQKNKKQKLGELNISYFESAFLNFFFKIFFFASSQYKSVKIYRVARIDRNCDDYYQAKSLICVIIRNTVYIFIVYSI